MRQCPRWITRSMYNYSYFRCLSIPSLPAFPPSPTPCLSQSMSAMSSEQTPLLGSSSAAVTNATSNPPPKPLSSQDNLTKFRIAIGINVDETGLADLEKARKRPRGLYKEIISIQRNRYILYQSVETLYYSAIIIQILIGAFLASLGSLPSIHPVAITVLGISNTFTAGVLALLKGQGLPERLRKDEYQMKKVQDFIEETEIRLALAGEGTLTVEALDAVVEQIFDKYNSARDTAEMNRSSSYALQVENGVNGGAMDGTGDGDGQVRGLRGMPRRTPTGGDSTMSKGKFAID